VPSGKATLKVTFNSWLGAFVGPTTHVVSILPRIKGFKEEPVSNNLIASIIHPDHLAAVWNVEFSSDGSKLFTTGYPSGIVQIWDLSSKTELRRIGTPPGPRSFANYALLTPDWKTLFVPMQKRTLNRIEQDGKRINLIEFTGSIRVWDVSSGREKQSIRSSKDTGPGKTTLSSTGRFLIWSESISHESSKPQPAAVTVVQELQSGHKWKLSDEPITYSVSRDEKTVIVGVYKTKSSSPSIKLLNLMNGKELARIAHPRLNQDFSIGPISPDGKLVAILLGSELGEPLETWLLDTRTLSLQGKLLGAAKPNVAPMGGGIFNKDGSRFIRNDGQGNVLSWNVATNKLESTFAFGGMVRRPVLSPDGNLMAVAWMPPIDPELAENLDIDPQDLPQPRLTLIDLNGKRPQRVLVAPHGFLGDVAFSPDGKLLACGSAGAVHIFDLSK
jgi:WD40 repeat protein